MPANLSEPHDLATRGARLLPVLVIGFAAAAAMWVVWFGTHLPAVRLSPVVAGPALLAVMVAALAVGCRAVPRARRMGTGAWAGLTAATIDLLVLGSKITQPLAEHQPGAAPTPAPGASGLRPEAWLIVLGFLGVGMAAGAAAGWLGRLAADRPPRAARVWLMRFAVVTACATLPLLAVGGLVTSAAAGMAVPDWPGTYGANMFLYPISLMADPRIYLEHTHRLFGSLVGLTTLTLLLLTIRFGPGRWHTAFAAALFVGVCAQGVMGGLRVEAVSRGLALVHGVTAQVFLAGVVAFAASLSPSFAAAREGAVTSRGRTLAGLLMAALFFQLLLGAMYRHLGSPHPLWAHAVFSVVVFGLCVVMGSRWIRLAREHPGEALLARLKPVGIGLHAVVTVQFLLGVAALCVVLLGPAAPRDLSTAQVIAEAPAINPILTLVRSLHQANGAVLLAVATLASVWTWRLSGAPRAARSDYERDAAGKPGEG